MSGGVGFGQKFSASDSDFAFVYGFNAILTRAASGRSDLLTFHKLNHSKKFTNTEVFAIYF